jgi:hypothetical protein
MDEVASESSEHVPSEGSATGMTLSAPLAEAGAHDVEAGGHDEPKPTPGAVIAAPWETPAGRVNKRASRRTARSSLGISGKNFLRLRDVQQRAEAFGFGARNGTAEARAPIVPALRTAARVVGGSVPHLDQPFIDHPREGGVERARKNRLAAAGHLRQRLHDGVAVHLAIGQGQQHTVGRVLERDQGGGVFRFAVTAAPRLLRGSSRTIRNRL